jgi:putative nucleotidyltransferase with HDIG domain
MPPTLHDLARQERTRRELLQQSDLVPPLPDLVARLLTMLARADTEPADLEGLLQNDQVLVARMLAMVNSPFYGLHRPIRSVKDAVMVLGFRGVRGLVLATSTVKLLQRDFACYGHEPRGLWLHAIAVAAGSRRIARACGVPADDAETLFVAGLLHDIGKLVLVGRLEGAGDDDVAFERERLGIDHTEMGALVAARWNLAPEIQRTIGGHHGEPAGVRSAPCAVVRLADALAHECGIGYLPGRAPSAPVDPADLELLALGDDWPGLRAELVSTMADAANGLASVSG